MKKKNLDQFDMFAQAEADAAAQAAAEEANANGKGHLLLPYGSEERAILWAKNAPKCVSCGTPTDIITTDGSSWRVACCGETICREKAHANKPKRPTTNLPLPTPNDNPQNDDGDPK